MSIDEYVKRLQENDKRTLERRAQRLKELTQIQTDGRLFASQREWDYAGEASESYINGNYRSTIFCCACALEQVLKYEYLKIPEHKYQDIKSCAFGELIKKCSKKEVLSVVPYLEEARILNNIRNTVAAHPLFIDVPIASDTDKQLRNEAIIKDIKGLLSLIGNIDKELKKKIEITQLVSETENKTYNLGKIIHRQEEIPYNLNGYWGVIEQDVLKFLALKSWYILKEILERLYGVTD